THQAATVRGECRADPDEVVDNAVRRHGRLAWPAGGGKPGAYQAVRRHGKHARPVRTELGGANPAVVSERPSDAGTRPRIPNLGNAIFSCGDYSLPIRTE